MVKRGLNTVDLSSIGSLYLWYDESDEGSITSSWWLVSQLNDKLGNDQHMNQLTSSRQPDTGIVTKNFRNVLSFDDDYLEESVTDSPASFTLFIATEVLSTDHANDSIIAFDGANDWQLDSGNSSEFRYRSSSSEHTTLSYGVNLINTPSIYTYVVNSATWDAQIYVDGILIDSVTDYTWLYSSSWEYTIWANRGENQFPEQNFYETIIYNGALLGSEINQVGKYLSNKWWLSWTDL